MGLVTALNDPVNRNIISHCGEDVRSKSVSHFLRTKSAKPARPINSLQVFVNILHVHLRVIPDFSFVWWWGGYGNVYFTIYYLIMTVLVQGRVYTIINK